MINEQAELAAANLRIKELEQALSKAERLSCPQANDPNFIAALTPKAIRGIRELIRNYASLASQHSLGNGNEDLHG